MDSLSVESPKVTLISIVNSPQVISTLNTPKVLTIFRGERGDPGISYKENQDVLVPVLKVWTLSKIPVNPQLSELYLNGQKQTFLMDYSINGQILSWLSIELSPTDYLEITYQCP